MPLFLADVELRCVCVRMWHARTHARTHTHTHTHTLTHTLTHTHSHTHSHTWIYIYTQVAVQPPQPMTRAHSHPLPPLDREDGSHSAGRSDGRVDMGLGRRVGTSRKNKTTGLAGVWRERAGSHEGAHPRGGADAREKSLANLNQLPAPCNDWLAAGTSHGARPCKRWVPSQGAVSSRGRGGDDVTVGREVGGGRGGRGRLGSRSLKVDRCVCVCARVYVCVCRSIYL